MTREALLKIKGVGTTTVERIEAGLTGENLTLEQACQLPAEEIKRRFGVRIDIARAVAAYQPEKTIETTVEKRLGKKTLAKLAKVTKPVKSTDKPSRSKPSVTTEKTTDNYFVTINRDDDVYPVKLKHLLGEKAPERLYFWGNLELLSRPAVGFCGSRDVTDKGLDATRDISQQVAKLGWVTVSGHARGVDITAHRTALENDSGTIIVLPEGYMRFKLRAELKEQANPDNTLIISEFAPTASWNVGYAMQRNATIIGLSDVMVLVEARDEGGTFSAGKTCLKLKQPLFVVKFQDKSKSNAGNDYFLQSGAYQLGKSPQTNRANIEPLIAKVKERQSNPEAEAIPQQLAMRFADES